MKLNNNRIIYLVILLSLSFSCATINHKQSEQRAYDGEIVAFLELVNHYEIDLAKKLLNKLKNKEAKSFAEFMINEHTKLNSEIEQISRDNKILPIHTTKILALKKDTEKEFKRLSSLKSPKLDKSYIDAMVNGHKDALHQIDSYLLNVHNPELRKGLEEAHHHVADHLIKAQQIQENMKTRTKPKK